MKTLKNLWYDYLIEEQPKSAEERAALSCVVKAVETLSATLNGDQKDMLEDYSTSYADLTSVLNEEAFICGVSFATNYLLEALGIVRQKKR